ncbi:hypothetical protein [Celeribacter sp.]|uniref:hypothetical protein n=1 Tax=Celeribacter sp. TaxID=1890673 RepID=UPI003A941BDA
MLRLVFGMLLLASPAHAISPEWTAQKCALYINAWDMMTDGGTLEGLSEPFKKGNSAFMATGCTTRGTVCPVSDAERAVADALSLMMVGEGATGSFLPFHCDG